MKRIKLIAARARNNWTLEQASEKIGCSPNTLNRWELGRIDPDAFFRAKLCNVYQSSVEDLGLIDREVSDAVSVKSKTISFIDDYSMYDRAIASLIDLYYTGNPHHVETLLPLLSQQVAILAKESPYQSVALIASHVSRLMCELETDRENFGAAAQAAQQALFYAQAADDTNLQVAAHIALSNISFHRKFSTAALQPLLQAVSLFKGKITPLLKGRVYAGLAETYAMRGQLQEAMYALGSAYEFYPEHPENDPAYSYLRASRYSLYVFGDVQSRLFLEQSDEAEKALRIVQQENRDAETEPITKLDLLYYQAQIQALRDLQAAEKIFAEAALLARQLGSKLYYNKLAMIYYDLRRKHPYELKMLEDVFQPW